MPADSPTRVEDLDVGTRLGPLELTISAEGNRRYFEGAGVSHALLDEGVLYPPMAANFTILLAQTLAGHQMLHTRQRLHCLGLARAGEALTVTGEVTGRSEKRGRTYVEITAIVANPDGPVWESTATFTSA